MQLVIRIADHRSDERAPHDQDVWLGNPREGNHSGETRGGAQVCLEAHRIVDGKLGNQVRSTVSRILSCLKAHAVIPSLLST